MRIRHVSGVVLLLAGCGAATARLAQRSPLAGSREPDTGLTAAGTRPPAARPVFAPPASIGDCRADRLEILEQEVDLGAPYPPWQYQPLEMSVSHHSHRVGGLIVLIVLRADPQAQVTGFDARRFDVAAGRWLPTVPDPSPPQRGLEPQITGVASGVIGEAVYVQWTDLARGTHVRRFAPATGTWSEADPATVVPSFNGLATHGAYPPNPEPTTSVKLEVSTERRTATFTGIDGRVLGTLIFTSRPGTYVGAFANRRTAFLWSNVPEATQRELPTAERIDSFLVGLETGSACRIPREIVIPGTTFFRLHDAIVMLNVLQTPGEESRCPEGRPCAAPKQQHFRGVSIATLRDRGE